MTTPTIVAVETAAIVYDGAWSHTTSASAQSGDIIALVHFAQGPGDGTDMSTPTSPSGGWTERRHAAEAGWLPAIKLWTRAAPVGTFTVTIPAVATSGHQGVIFILRGATEAPEASAESSGDSTSGHVTPSVTATTADALILRAIATRGGNGATYSWPSSTERTDSEAGSDGGGAVFSTATKAATASGAQGTETCTGTAVSNWGEYVGLTAAFGGAAGSGATVTPSVIAATVAMPGSARSLGATATPAAVAAAAALPASTRSAGSTVSPAAITAPAALPAATRSAGSTVTPAAIASSTTVPAASVSVSGSATATPAVVAATATLPGPTSSAGSTATPAVLAVTTTAPAATRSAGSTTTPAAVATTTTVPAAAATASSTVTPTAVSAIVSIPLVNLVAASTVLPAAIGATVTLPLATVNGASRDLELAVGQPELKWHTYTPATGWTTGPAEARWNTGNPQT